MTKLIREKGSPPQIPFIGRIQNRVWRDSGRFGLFDYGDYEFGSENAIGRDLDGVYQMRRCLDGIIPVKMRFQETREEVATPARVANWNKYAAGIAAWQALTPEQKAVYNERANGKRLTGNNIFIKEYMLS